MYSKALLRSAIDNKKSEYFDNDVSYALVEASIYKGLYLAIGGKIYQFHQNLMTS